MKIVEYTDIELWANTVDIKGSLPAFISRLVHAATPYSTKISFPSGAAVYLAGWDGIVDCPEARWFVPDGISLWELGSGKNFLAGKSSGDINKRTNNPLGKNPKECTYVALTPRLWSDKENWKTNMLATGVWKDVRAYDARDIAEWLDKHGAIAKEFARYIGIAVEGFSTSEEYWEDWSATGTTKVIVPELVTVGREHEKAILLDYLRGKQSIKLIRAASKKEATAFIIACAKQFEPHDKEKFFARTLIFDTNGAYKAMRGRFSVPMNVIPKFDDEESIYGALSKGHHVIIPLGPDDEDLGHPPIILPGLPEDGLVKALMLMGYDRNIAERLVKESNKDLTLLKRKIRTQNLEDNWANFDNIRELIPALLIGKWNQNNAGDKEILRKLSGRSYSDYLQILNKWKSINDSPVRQIGETWRLSSPLDAWATLTATINENDLKELQESFLYAFVNGNPQQSREIEDPNLVSYATQDVKFSKWAREGLAQTLILIGKYGTYLSIPSLPNPQEWVDNIITSLLENASADLWISLEHELPLISEAAPSVFLQSVSKSLSQEESPIMKLFEESPGFFDTVSHHTGLLWALEGLAWLPEYLSECSEILIKLSVLDPGGSLSNRPFNSLAEIFKPWHPQTLATFDARVAVLNKIISIEPGKAWEFLLRLLPQDHSVGFGTHKLKWRAFDRNTTIEYSEREMALMHSQVLDMLLQTFDNSESKLLQLLESATSFYNYDEIEKVLVFAESVIADMSHSENKVWHGIRKILAHHRKYHDTDWALPEYILKHYESIGQKLEPEDIVPKYLWLFEEHWPQFEEEILDDLDDNYEQHGQRLIDKRLQGVRDIYTTYGLNRIIELSNVVKYPIALGDALGRFISNQEVISDVVKLLFDDGSNKEFIKSFLYRLYIDRGLDWFIGLFEELKRDGLQNELLAELIAIVNASKSVWEYVNQKTNDEIQTLYWARIQLNIYNLSSEDKALGIEYLLEHKRFIHALYLIYLYVKEIPIVLIIRALETYPQIGSEEKDTIKTHEVQRLFDALYASDTVAKDTILRLEWYYIKFLSSRRNFKRQPLQLHIELAQNPSFFVDLLKWLYTPKDKNLLALENAGVDDEVLHTRASKAFSLLESWRNIPGVDNENIINEKELTGWINEVRALAAQADRTGVADAQIGKILAQFPESEENWPPKEIASIIEQINSDSLKRNYSTALYNKRGFTTRAAYAGGDIERDNAKFFRSAADNNRNQYPNLASIFDRLADSYLNDARRMDEEAERDSLEH